MRLVTGDDRPLRADAERNRAKILQAAADVFAARGLAATLHDVAARAGVGVGTVYRRFPDKEALIEALFEDELRQLFELAQQAEAAPDPVQGLFDFLHATVRRQAENRGLHEVLHSSGYGQRGLAAARAELLPRIDALLERAQQQGGVRPDLDTIDLTMITIMLGAVSQYAADVRPDAWERYLQLLLDALRAGPDRSRLSVPALNDEELMAAMSSWQRHP